MTAQNIQRQQQAVMPKGDLAPYAGQWVALRNGEVIASDMDAKRLREHMEVREDDVLVPVGHPDRGYFIL